MTTSTDTPSARSPDTESAHHRKRRSFLSLWDRHPGVKSGDDLTVGERAADHLRNGMGSWPFVFGALIFLSLWMLYNRNSGFDKYPFILLNLVLSCLAAMQGAILLIAAKRSDQISSELAQHDFETDERAADRIEAVHERLQRLAEDNQSLLEQNTQMLERLASALSATATGSATPPAPAARP